jgi:iron complex outermembrane receptor protein
VFLRELLIARGTKFGAIQTGSITEPVFQDIYTPLDGFVANGGIFFRELELKRPA